MNPDTAHTVQQLSHYLWRHPNACDTAEGIARWWLLGARTSPPLPVVLSALDHLQALGVEPMPGTAAQMGSFARAEREKWGRVITKVGVKLD